MVGTRELMGMIGRASYNIPDIPDCLSIQRSLRWPSHVKRGPLKFRKSAESCGFLEVSLVLGFSLIPNAPHQDVFVFTLLPHPASNLPPTPSLPNPLPQVPTPPSPGSVPSLSRRPFLFSFPREIYASDFEPSLSSGFSGAVVCRLVIL